MSAARDQILARIRAVDRGRREPASRAYRRTGALGAGARVELFAERVTDYRAEVGLVAADEVGAALADACREHGASRIGIPPGFPADWRAHGLELLEDHGLAPRELDTLEGVATGCTVAIAETGTIVLAGGPTEGRRALTLVPDLHVCVVRRDQIVELVPEAISALEPLVARERRPLTFISGPSATSDIELNRVEGVHGPRTLVALIVDEEER